MTEFDKYAYYLQSVQSPDEDVVFFEKTFRELTGRKAVTMREDFCAAAALSCAWAAYDPSHHSLGIDLDEEPIAYGRKNYLSKLGPEAQSRVKTFVRDVRARPQPEADLVVVCNFSFFCFKERAVLVDYLKGVYDSIKAPGMVLLDAFGGPACTEPNENETEHDEFSYFWDQDTFNPITHEAMYYIHFKLQGEEKRRERVFSYDWRMWSIPEIRDILAEVGFRKTVVYWEGSDEEGEGNGEFMPTEVGDDCESWLAYIVGLK